MYRLDQKVNYVFTSGTFIHIKKYYKNIKISEGQITKGKNFFLYGNSKIYQKATTYFFKHNNL